MVMEWFPLPTRHGYRIRVRGEMSLTMVAAPLIRQETSVIAVKTGVALSGPH